MKNILLLFFCLCMISCTKSGSNVKVGVSQEATDIPQKIFGHWSKISNMKGRANIDFFYYTAKAFFIDSSNGRYRFLFPWSREWAYIDEIITISENEIDIRYNYWDDTKQIVKIKFIDYNSIVVIPQETNSWFPENEIAYYRVDIIASSSIEYKATHEPKRVDVRIYEFPNIESTYKTVGETYGINMPFQVFTDEQIEILKTRGMEGLEEQNKEVVDNGIIKHFVLVYFGVYGWCFIEDLDEL